ncbi:MAG: hypothetical protein GXX99_00345 [Clostridiales bacterium]|nr:hypothetical protein [Clostridiales bacterium]
MIAILIGYYNKSVWLTYLGLASSVLGMTLALNGRLYLALALLLFSGLCDMYDGTLAALVERSDAEKKFGIQIDSLCDVVCFSAFPAIIAFSVAGSTPLCLLTMVMIVAGGAIRLGYFNVQEELRQAETDEKRTHYQGLPVTASAIILPIGVIVFRLLAVELSLGLPLLNGAIAVANVLNIRISKPQQLGKLLLLALGLISFFTLLYMRRKGV